GLMLDTHGFSDCIFLPGQTIPSYKPSLALIDAATGRLVRRVPLSPAIVNMPYVSNPPDALAFSPDGSTGARLVGWPGRRRRGQRSRSPSVAGSRRRRLGERRTGDLPRRDQPRPVRGDALVVGR